MNTLKTNLKVIIPGKVQKLNVIEQLINDSILRTLKKNTLVVLVFDTDTNNANILKMNIEKLNSSSVVSKVIAVPQVPNLEKELIRSCNINKITELLDSRNEKEFKRDLIHITNLDKKLKEHSFNINKLWSQPTPKPFDNIKNESKKIKC